jgi:hypothetical protein
MNESDFILDLIMYTKLVSLKCTGLGAMKCWKKIKIKVLQNCNAFLSRNENFQCCFIFNVHLTVSLRTAKSACAFKLLFYVLGLDGYSIRSNDLRVLFLNGLKGKEFTYNGWVVFKSYKLV